VTSGGTEASKQASKQASKNHVAMIFIDENNGLRKTYELQLHR
jgi:hypothetical protein